MSIKCKAKFAEDCDPYGYDVDDITGVCDYDDNDEEALLKTIANVTRIFPVRWLTESPTPPFGTLFFFKEKVKKSSDSVSVIGQKHKFCINPGESIVQLITEVDDELQIVIAKCNRETANLVRNKMDTFDFVEALKEAGIPVVSVQM